MNFQYQNKTYQIKRYPQTSNHSLKAWSAADEYILKYLQELDISIDELSQQKTTENTPTIAIYNDRFGFLTILLNELKDNTTFNTLTIINNKSQEKACIKNIITNDISESNTNFETPLTVLPPIDVALIKISKSLELFQLHLNQISQSLVEGGMVICAFMTRQFSPQFLKIGETFFEEATQSKAWKKSRLLILKNKKQQLSEESKSIINTIDFEGKTLQQYYGVFSAKNIDYATQFLIEHLNVKQSDQSNQCVLDLASGNGVLGLAVREKNPNCELHLLDDSFLAIESSKLNLPNLTNLSNDEEQPKTYFHHNDCLENFEDDFFDLIVTNPPFHFEYEIDVSVAIQLFKEVKHCLKSGGRFQLVANQHLNYKTHLLPLFNRIDIVAENKKFVVYECQ